jgi:hypothetical protein
MAGNKRPNRVEARSALPKEQQATFDELCDEVIGWSKFYYGSTFVSYAILMELVKGGWARQKDSKPREE